MDPIVLDPEPFVWDLAQFLTLVMYAVAAALGGLALRGLSWMVERSRQQYRRVRARALTRLGRRGVGAGVAARSPQPPAGRRPRQAGRL